MAEGDFDIDHNDPLRRDLEDAAAAHEAVILDLSGVTFADSTFLTVLMRIHQDTPLRIAAPTEQVERLLRLTGVDQVMGLYSSVVEACESVPRADQ